jgi:hypothetical protein
VRTEREPHRSPHTALNAIQGHSRARGLLLALILSAANANDSTLLEAVLEDIPAIRMPTGRRRRRPGKVHADKTSHAVRRQAGAGRFVPLRWANAACSW